MRISPQLALITCGLAVFGFVLSRHAATNHVGLSTVSNLETLPTELTSELLTNSDFEQAGSNLPAAWSRDAARTGKEGAAFRDTTGAHHGSASLQLAPNGENGGGSPLAVSQIIPAVRLKGRRLSYSADVLVQGNATAHVGLLTIADGKPQHLEMLTQDATSDWKTLKGTYEVGSGEGMSVVFICWVDGKSGQAWFDNASLRVDGGNATQSADAKAEPVTEGSASIRIDASRVLRKLPSTLYGTNMEWIWNGNGAWLPGENRPDPQIAKLTQEMGVRLIRYPGGVYSDFYHWQAAVGPAEKRAEMQHMPGVQEQSRPNFGTDEALKFAEATGAELLITVNAGTGTAKEAADWVRYVNLPRRRVRYWEVGNELYLKDTNLGPHAITITPQQYAERLVEFATAMRAVDPEIKILAIGGENHGSYTTVAYLDWDRIVLAKAADQIDYLSVHNAYAPLLKDDKQDLRTVYRAMLAAPDLVSANLAAIQQQIHDFAPQRASKIGIAVTEWGPAFRFDFSTRYLDHGKTLGSALYAASAFQSLLASPTTTIANFWQLNDYSVLGWIGTRDTRFPPHPDWILSARGMAFGMFTRYFGPQLVHSEVVSPSFQSVTVGLTDGVKAAADLTVSAALSEDGRHLYVITVNRSLSHNLHADVDIAGFRPEKVATSHVLNGSAIDANTGTGVVKVPGLQLAKQADDGENGRFTRGGASEIQITDGTVQAGNRMAVIFPPHSITALVLTRAGQ